MVSINVKLTEEELKELQKFKKGSWKQFLFKGLWLKGCLLRNPAKDWESWKIKDVKREKPCHKAGVCPYGQLVEEFPHSAKRTEFSCKLFGHDCPIFYCGEPLKE